MPCSASGGLPSHQRLPCHILGGAGCSHCLPGPHAPEACLETNGRRSFHLPPLRKSLRHRCLGPDLGRVRLRMRDASSSSSVELCYARLSNLLGFLRCCQDLLNPPLPFSVQAVRGGRAGTTRLRQSRGAGLATKGFFGRYSSTGMLFGDQRSLVTHGMLVWSSPLAATLVCAPSLGFT